MPVRTTATHAITVPVPIEQCFRLFTPAGEKHWVDGWRPYYIIPSDGHTEASMVFTTGTGADFTIWTLTDFNPATHTSRYVRTTPALRNGTVEIQCVAVNRGTTSVTVTYTLTALTVAGEQSLAAFEGPAFARMIDGWRDAIQARLPALLAADIK